MKRNYDEIAALIYSSLCKSNPKIASSPLSLSDSMLISLDVYDISEVVLCLYSKNVSWSNRSDDSSLAKSIEINKIIYQWLLLSLYLADTNYRGAPSHGSNAIVDSSKYKVLATVNCANNTWF